MSRKMWERLAEETRVKVPRLPGQGGRLTASRRTCNT